MTRTTHKQQAFINLLSLMDEIGEPPCAENPTVFFPDDYLEPENRQLSIQVAKVYCAECPIKIQCAEYAIVAKEQHGIWGGLTPSERGH